jgi:hypothetical protein
MFDTVQGRFGVIQGTFDVIQGTFGVIRRTFGVIQGTFTWAGDFCLRSPTASTAGSDSGRILDFLPAGF